MRVKSVPVERKTCLAEIFASLHLEMPLWGLWAGFSCKNDPAPSPPPKQFGQICPNVKRIVSPSKLHYPPIGIIERGVPQAYLRTRASSATLCLVRVLRVFPYIYFIKKGIWYVSQRAWIHIYPNPYPLVTVPPLMIILTRELRCPNCKSELQQFQIAEHQRNRNQNRL